MNSHLNIVLIRDIFKDFTNGNPLWGIARLNEYTSTDSLLRKSILKRFNSEIEMVNIENTTLNKLLNGFKLNELTTSEKEIVKTISRNRKSERKIIVKNKSFRERKDIILNNYNNFSYYKRAN